ncbi:DUF4352 domain-containing protein [Sporosarcina sp. ACRSL]|uniref:DUF4352 domain-containing protein n=1 Tax=Sporosarcina sp. ACRSL TaxID=2918215 RepID=UPI001EF41C9B|nr:DUF4352 domain-containing protein [Sporosarcina sp. ACRSL]MCG7346587.1 DUF4352 domain-containing protein [Sporosarcina sp. ACRSL]
MANKPLYNRALLLALIGSIGLAVFLLVKPESSSVEQVQAEKDVAFTSDVIQFENKAFQLTGSPSVEQAQADKNLRFTSGVMQIEDMAVQLTGSSHSKTEQTFYFTVENISNVEISTNSTLFTIKNKGNVYSSWNVDIEESRLNPGMSTTATVTFKMLDSYLMEGEPLMKIQRGVFFPTIMEFEMEKER